MQLPLAITGLGLTTSLGIGVAENWQRLWRGESGIAPLKSIDVSDYPVKDGGEIPDPPLGEAFEDGRPASPELRHLLAVCLEASEGALGEDALPLDPERVGLAIGSSMASSATSDTFFRQRRDLGVARADYTLLQGYCVDQHFQYLSDGLRWRGPTVLVSNACAAGAGAVIRAADWIRSGRCDAALAAGYDAFSIFTFSGFGSLFALSQDQCRPFAAERDGMKIGGGYAALFLEPLAAALEASRDPIALLSGYGESSDAHHLTHPHPEGLGASLAMQRALSVAGLLPGDIDAINSHATATTSNDASEVRAMIEVFGDRLPSIPVFAPKPAVGHTLGGAGAVEAVMSVFFIQNQRLAPTLNVGEIGPGFEVKLDLIQQPRAATLRHVMSNSFGFGGSNASLIFSAHPGEEDSE